jgi:arsenite methyltransferase
MKDCCQGTTTEGTASIEEVVRERYAAAATAVKRGEPEGCCAPGSEFDLVTGDLYTETERDELPGEAVQAALGCGNPTALAQLTPGEVVLDLGSGGGIDVLLSARRVAPGGHAYGLDMTDEMLELARENQRKAGVENAEFLKGRIEEIPLPDASVDVILSNCVVNLSTDKDRVFREAFRVLRPGGRLAISDIVVQGRMDPVIRRSVELWAGCVAGALEEGQVREKLARAGFEDVEVEVTRVYDADMLPDGAARAVARLAAEAMGDGRLVAAFIRARRPG